MYKTECTLCGGRGHSASSCPRFKDSLGVFEYGYLLLIGTYFGILVYFFWIGV